MSIGLLNRLTTLTRFGHSESWIRRRVSARRRVRIAHIAELLGSAATPEQRSWDNAGMTMREIVILGSTGSVGTQALAVIADNPERFRVVGLAAGGGNPRLLAEQALRFGVQTVAVAQAGSARAVEQALDDELARRWATDNEGGATSRPKVIAGPQAATELAGHPCDLVLNAMTGSIGLSPTLAALSAGRTLALANKESLVAGGALVRAVAQENQIVPVDSEHSALAQCLRAGSEREISRLILTASGGPFRGRSRDELRGVTLGQAFEHPTWNMGPVITLNSATLVNKGLELIEAHELFRLSYDQLDVVVHPQSLVHSMVEFVDGAVIGQVSNPDMRLPISLALSWPDRLPDATPAPRWDAPQSWEFFPVDHETFPAIMLAAAAGRTGKLAPAIYNAANEECVAAFQQGRLRFLGIVDTVAEVLEASPGFDEPGSVDDVLAAEEWARRAANEFITRRAR